MVFFSLSGQDVNPPEKMPFLKIQRTFCIRGQNHAPFLLCENQCNCCSSAACESSAVCIRLPPLTGPFRAMHWALYPAGWPPQTAGPSRLQSPAQPCPSDTFVAGCSPRIGTGLQPATQTSSQCHVHSCTHRHCAAVGTYPGPDQSAVSVYRFADEDVVAGEVKRFASQGEVDAGLPDGPPDESLSCHHSLACRHWRGGHIDTVLRMLRPSALHLFDLLL